MFLKDVTTMVTLNILQSIFSTNNVSKVTGFPRTFNPNSIITKTQIVNLGADTKPLHTSTARNNKHGPKICGALPPFWGGATGSPSNTKSPGLRPTTIPSGILMHPAIWQGTVEMGRKLGRGAPPLLRKGGWVPI